MNNSKEEIKRDPQDIYEGRKFVMVQKHMKISPESLRRIYSKDPIDSFQREIRRGRNSKRQKTRRQLVIEKLTIPRNLYPAKRKAQNASANVPILPEGLRLLLPAPSANTPPLITQLLKPQSLSSATTLSKSLQLPTATNLDDQPTFSPPLLPRLESKMNLNNVPLSREFNTMPFVQDSVLNDGAKKPIQWRVDDTSATSFSQIKIPAINEVDYVSLSSDNIDYGFSNPYLQNGAFGREYENDNLDDFLINDVQDSYEGNDTTFFTAGQFANQEGTSSHCSIGCFGNAESVENCGDVEIIEEITTDFK